MLRGKLKTNVLLNLIKHQQPDLDKICLYVKNPLESKYQLLLNGREKVGLENLKNLKEFIDYSQTIDDAYENVEDYSLTKKRTVLKGFDDMIADMESNERLSHKATELFEEEENLIFHLLLNHNLISKYLK